MNGMFRALFETAPDAMIVVDRTGHIALANPQAERLFGYAGGALAGSAIEVLIPERARGVHVAHRDRYMDAPRVRPMGAGQELIGRRADGTEFPVEIALSPITTDEGAYFAASIRDISETQRARQALVRARHDGHVARISERALASPNSEALIEELPDFVADALEADFTAIALIDVQGRPQLRATNEAGAASGEAFALALEHERDVALAFQATEPRILGGSPQDAAWLHRAGYASGLCVPLRDRQRSIGALFALSSKPRIFDHDATHFLQSVANVVAAALLRARTMDQLAHAQRLDAVGQLTGGIAHDFNNLLTVVSGNLQVLESEVADRPEALELIANALRAVGSGADLTRKLLAFARRQRLAPQALSPQTLLVELSAMLRRTLGEPIAIEVECRPGTSAVFADPSQLDAALLNLALNARDAMPRGGRLRIEARDVTHAGHDGARAAGPWVLFSVRDTGIGMAPEVLARACEPFYTTKAAGKGSGLGLSMVYGFVTQSGGHLAVDSELGYGTTIELYLPCAEGERTAAVAAPSADAQRGSGTVLVVEDEPEVLKVAVSFLRSLGYEPVAVADATAALETFERRLDIDAVFSDIALGVGPDGRELARELARRRPGLPILLTSGFEGDVAASSDALHLPLLPKPYRREQLADALQQLLQRAPGPVPL